MIYDVITLGLKPNTLGAVLAQLPAGLAGDIRAGTLLGCFMCDIGALNRALVLTAYESLDALHQDRAHSADNNPFGVGDHLNAVDRTAYRPLNFMGDIVIGSYGPFYEIRNYELETGGLPETEAAWGKAVDQRQKISTILMVMASVDATPQRMLHMWPYRSLNDRTDARAMASKAGIWPPPGGPNLLLSLKSEIFVPTSFSPLT